MTCLGHRTTQWYYQFINCRKHDLQTNKQIRRFVSKNHELKKIGLKR